MKKMMKILMFSILLSMTLTGCTSVSKDKSISKDLQIDENAEIDAEIEADIEEASALLKEHGADAAKIWPGYELPNNAIIVCLRDDETDNVIHAWKLTTAEKTELTNEQLSGVEVPAAGGYNGIKFEGKKSIIIAVNKATIPELKKVAIVNYIYEIGVHEMVHLHYESMIKLIKLGNEQKKHGGRATDFPKAAEPRVYRKMLYDNLAAAFENPHEEELYLGRAKYWHEKWKNEYSGEYYQIKVTDVLEGKARYIQYMMCMPKNISEAEKAAWISEHFDKSPEPSVSMDSESYKLGFAAGVILDRRDSEWKKQVTKKAIPITEYLLENVEIVEDDTEKYESLMEISEVQMAEINQELAGKLGNIQKTESDTKIPMLQMTQKQLKGSFETTDFLNYVGKSLIVDFAGTFENKNGTVIVDHVNVYQGDSGYLVPLTMDYELNDGRLVIDADGVSGSILVKQSTDKDGRIIFTMK